MKTMTFLLLFSVIMAGMPTRSWAEIPAISATEKAELSALSQPKLLLQSAGDVVIVNNRRGWRRRTVVISTGAIILTAVVVTLIVLGTRAPSSPKNY